MSEYIRNRQTGEGDSFFCRFTFGQFFALLVLEVFTLFFVFYLGARYGREFLGLENVTVVGEEPAAEETAVKVPTTGDPEVRAMADELIAKARTPELKDRIRKMITDAQEKPAPAKGEDVPQVISRNRADEIPPAPDVAEEVREDVAAGGGQEPPAEVKAQQVLTEPSRAGASDSSVIRIKSAENARYSVQIGSYPQIDEATRIVDRWKGKGYPAYMMIADIPDRGRWYRVRIGGFETRDDATVYMNEIKSRESVDALVVLNEQ